MSKKKVIENAREAPEVAVDACDYFVDDVCQNIVCLGKYCYNKNR